MAKPEEPGIDTIVAPIVTPGTDDFIQAGELLEAGPPGTVLLLVGRGFGADSTAVVANFGDKTVEVFPPPLFNETQILVSAPLMAPGSVLVSVTVAGVRSNEISFQVQQQPRLPHPLGTSARRFLATLDPFMVLLSAEIRIADFGRFATRQFQEQLAENVLNARVGLLETRKRLDEIEIGGRELTEMVEVKYKRIKARVDRIAQRAAEKSLLLFDQFVESSQILHRLDAAMARIREGGTSTATKTLEISAETAGLAADIASSVESGLQSFSFSVSGGIVIAEGDASSNPAVAAAAGAAAGASTVASQARIAALLSRNADAARQEQEEMEFRWKIEGKLDRLEGKLDKVEGKADRAEGKLDRLEGKADQAESKLDRVEGKADKAESKLDRLEGKADKAEAKLDQIEGKLDKNEIKNDIVEGKLDRLEPKIDRAESKLDKLEKKVDQVESKLDKLEWKADKGEQKLDRLPLPSPPFEGSIANQRGGAGRVTAAVAAIRGSDDLAFLRAAIDKDSADLDDVNAWSQWVLFGRPDMAGVLVEVSIDLQYEEGSDTILNALLSARDQAGKVYHRVFERLDHTAFLDPDRWSEWQTFLNQP